MSSSSCAGVVTSAVSHLLMRSPFQSSGGRENGPANVIRSTEIMLNLIDPVDHASSPLPLKSESRKAPSVGTSATPWQKPGTNPDRVTVPARLADWVDRNLQPPGVPAAASVP